MIDKNEAPEGYEAVEYSEAFDQTCEVCSFYHTDCDADLCDRESRNDNREVIFVRKHERV